jgi:hypothetical protein
MAKQALKKSREQIKAELGRSEVLEQAKDARKGTNGITKRSVTFHKASPGDGDQFTVKDAGDFGMNTAVMQPNDEQLAKINQYTRSPKAAHELVVFPTLSCNTMPDRDDDYFDKETVDGFAELPAPYGPNGKSYMVGHDYTKLPTGRIFDTGTADAMDTHFLTNMVYVPNTEQYKAFIENIDFGINWAVSVGVMLDAQLCSICGVNQYSFFGMAFCENGHWKGEYYDPNETETDSWGDILTADPNDPAAVKCMGNMHGARDFYELSQVFLGAQFNAQLAEPDGKSAAMASAVNKGVLLSRKLPILGLRREEAEVLPLQHSDPKVDEALQKFSVTREDDGTLKWADEQGLFWRAAPGEAVVCLGKMANTTEGAGDGASTEDEQEPADSGEAAGAGEVGAAGEEPGDDDGGSGDEGDDLDDPGVGDGDPDEVGADGDLSGDEDDDSGQKGADSAMSKKAVTAALQRVKAPQVMLDAIADAEDATALEAVLRAAASSIGDLSQEVDGLKPKASLGEKFLAAKRADAIDAFVKSHAGQEGGIDISRFEKMLDAFGDDVEQIEFVEQQYRAQVKSKLPAGVRRSSEPEDPNIPKEPRHGAPGTREVSDKGGKVVSRIHG